MVNTLRHLRKQVSAYIDARKNSEYATIHDGEIMCAIVVLDLIEGELHRCGWYESEEAF